MFCECKNIPIGEGVCYTINNDTFEEKIQKLKRYGNTVETKSFGSISGHDIARDMIKNKFIDVLERNENRLRQLMQEYWTSEKSDKCAQILEIQKHQLAQIGQDAYGKFIDFDWEDMNKLEYVIINNAFQASDPRRYPLDDKELKAIFDAVTIGSSCTNACTRSNRIDVSISSSQ
jgi:hypothetical protein